ncbi:sulfite exporter TauE/SafE family protein [Massilia sp. TSP1-1-2]|uniref:sulfite exporter TauE/SafE family protein n=1 Tax=unclassified Massilia TaxID=2609279 RepID=UPI003CF1D0AD
MDLNLFPVFVVGLAGSLHCVGMCGGIVSAFSMAPAGRSAFPVAVVTQAAPRAADSALRMAAYNTGRIASYAAAGAIAGGLAGGARTLAGLEAWQTLAYWFANAMLVLLGLYLTGAWAGLARLEQLGQGLWRKLRPLMGKLLPIDSPFKMLALGALWGWLPCGMVYSVLLTAMLAGSAPAGAAVMLAFGLGTLPMLLALGAAGARLQRALQNKHARAAGGLLVLAFGLLGMLRAAGGVSHGWLDALCLSGAGA